MKFLVFWAICLLSLVGFQEIQSNHYAHKQLRDAIYQLKCELSSDCNQQ